MGRNQTVVVLDFGGQYKELIARRVRECRVYSVILSSDEPLEKIRALDPIGIITTGGPASVYADSSPKCDPALFSLGIPILGICYGMQLMAWTLGGRVESCSVSEYGTVDARVQPDSPLFAGLEPPQTVLMSHTDRVTRLPEGFRGLAATADCPIAAMADERRKLYGVQFHPEVTHTKNGKKMLRNFLYRVCGAKGDYTMNDYIDTQVAEIRRQAPEGRVLLALSGGVDSAVCAALLSRALPGRVVCIFVDHGFMRKDEGRQVKEAFEKFDLQLRCIDASERFLAKLKGVSEPEQKRKLVGAEFIAVFNEEAAKLGDIRYLAQGTIYPDIIESGNGKAATIKSHHNVGGLPKNIRFEGLIEPLRHLFKDEVRVVGKKLGLPDAIVNRQPFPGPGLCIRIIGEVTREKLDLLREADAILREEIGTLRRPPSQYFAVLTDLRSVGVMGDERTYEYTLALRAIQTGDFMTGEYSKLPHALLSRISRRITNEVKGVNRVVYDITDKPPATVEWE